MKDNSFCKILVGVLTAHGVTDAVISPGSRNTPLIMALDEASGIRKHTVIDERCAAFIALGQAQLTRRPVILCCTSGTALLNYAPAIAEAYYQGVPLIIMSADRPSEWIDQDDSQTIRQPGILDHIVKKSFSISCTDAGEETYDWYVDRVANEAYLSSVNDFPGPVHVNVHLDDPLNILSHSCCKKFRTITQSQANVLPADTVKELAYYAAEKKILVVAGQYPPSNKVNRAINILSNLPNVAVWTECIANIHVKDVVGCIDRTLLEVDSDDRDLHPDIIISFGGALVSRRCKQYLRSISGVEHWQISPQRDFMADPFQKLTRIISISPEIFLPQFANRLCRCHPCSHYRESWRRIVVSATERHEQVIADAPWSALKFFSVLVPRIPVRCNVQLSNGTPVRYAQLFDMNRVHACYCNRGVSGIDGSTSTAIGAALHYAEPTVLITGDMSFAYDIGALATHFINYDLKIIVINNSGGEIFRFIKTTSKLTCREQYFSVAPLLPLRELAHAYGFDYCLIDSENSLKRQLNKFLAPSLYPSIMEVKVDPDVSARTLSNYFNYKK